LAALELDLGPVVTRQDEDAYIFADPRTGKRDTPAGPMETSMWWLDIRRLSWRLHGRRSGTALIDFQRRCLAADYGARATGFEPVFGRGRVTDVAPRSFGYTTNVP
jgi:hypothetical protein